MKTVYVVSGAGNKRLHLEGGCTSVNDEESSIREASGQERESFPKCRNCFVKSVECEYCGSRYGINGIGAHKRYCEQNPDRVGAKVPVLDS